MINRRDALKLGLAAAGSSLIDYDAAKAQSPELLKFLCPPDGVHQISLRGPAHPRDRS